MDEVEVDAIGRQPAEAARHGLHDSPRQAALVHVGAHREVDFRRDHQFVAVAGHHPAQDLLRSAAGVDICAVEEVDASIAAAPEHGGGRGFVRVAAERHRAKAQARHLHARAAEGAILHENNLLTLLF